MSARVKIIVGSIICFLIVMIANCFTYVSAEVPAAKGTPKENTSPDKQEAIPGAGEGKVSEKETYNAILKTLSNVSKGIEGISKKIGEVDERLKNIEDGQISKKIDGVNETLRQINNNQLMNLRLKVVELTNEVLSFKNLVQETKINTGKIEQRLGNLDNLQKDFQDIKTQLTTFLQKATSAVPQQVSGGSNKPAPTKGSTAPQNPKNAENEAMVGSFTLTMTILFFVCVISLGVIVVYFISTYIFKKKGYDDYNRKNSEVGNRNPYPYYNQSHPPYEQTKGLINTQMNPVPTSLPRVVESKLNEKFDQINNSLTTLKTLQETTQETIKGEAITIKNKLRDIYDKISSKSHVDPIKEEKKFEEFNEENLIKWWEKYGSKGWNDCEISLKETFGCKNLIANVLHDDPRNPGNWYVMKIKNNPGIDTYYVLPRVNACYIGSEVETYFDCDESNRRLGRDSFVSGLIKLAKKDENTRFKKGVIQVEQRC